MQLQGQAPGRCDGYAMAALLVAIGVMGVMLSVAMPAWRTIAKREKEEELIFRGMQYSRAVGLFQRKYAAAYPPDLDTLIKGKFLRKKYKDPMAGDGEFQVLYQVNVAAGGQVVTGREGARGNPAVRDQRLSQFGPQAGTGQGPGGRGGILGVVSKSTDKSLRQWNGRSYYNEWQFIYVPNAMQPGMGGSGGPGGTNRGQGPGFPGMGGRGGQGRGMGPGGQGRGMGGRGRGFTFDTDTDGNIRNFGERPGPGRGGRGPGG